MALLQPALRLALSDLFHRRARTAAAMVGVIFAIVLLFMQAGFYLACRDSATRIQSLLDFDVVITSARYAFVMKADSLSRDRVEQARAVDGVADVASVRVGPGQWRSQATGRRYDVVLLGVVPADRPFRLAELNDELPRLRRGETVLFDRASHPVLGENPTGSESEFEGRHLLVVGTFGWGSGFVANGLAVTSEETFGKVFPGRPRDAVQFGLVRLEPGASVRQVVQELRRRLPADADVWSRAEIEGKDRRFFLGERPIGLMFTSGVFLAVLVGGVILFQILASEVISRRTEFATLKALGYDAGQIYSVVLAQGFLYALIAFVPAALLAAVLFEITRRVARLPMELGPGLLAAVLATSLLMCLAGAMVAARKVRRADPAELF